MKYLVVMIDGKEQPIILGKGIDVDVIATALGAPVIAAGVAHVQELLITCDGSQTVKGKEVGSRGLTDEHLLRSSDFID